MEDSISLLPDDLIYTILDFLDYRLLLPVSIACKQFNNQMNRKLIQVLNKVTKLIIDGYSLKQLIHLYKMRTEKSILAGDNYYVCLSIYNEELNTSEVYFSRPQTGFLKLNVESTIVGLSTINRTILLDNNNQLYALGVNNLTPFKLHDYPNNIKEIQADLLLTDDGSLYRAEYRWTSSDKLIVKSTLIDNNVRLFGWLNRNPIFIKQDNNLYINNIIIAMPEMIISLSSRIKHLLLLSITGNVYSYGKGTSGELGLKQVQETNHPILIPRLKNIVQISAGYEYSLALDIDGKVYEFGKLNYASNESNCLDDHRTPKTFDEPVLIQNLKDIIQIKAGDYYSLAMDSEHNVYGFGINYKNHFGLTNVDHSSETILPTIIFPKRS